MYNNFKMTKTKKIKNNSVINVILPRELKESFTIFATEMGTNPTNLIKMFITSSLNSNKLSFTTRKRDYFEVEPLDTSSWWEEFNKKTEELNKEAKDIFSKLKTQWKL